MDSVRINLIVTVERVSPCGYSDPWSVSSMKITKVVKLFIASTAPLVACLSATAQNRAYSTPESSAAPVSNWTPARASVPVYGMTTDQFQESRGVNKQPLSDPMISEIKPRSSDAIQYVSPHGKEANDGLSWGTAKLTVFGACEALPGGGRSPATCGSGTIYFSDASSAAPFANAGLWLMGALDPNFARPPAGWLRVSGPISIIGTPTRNSGPNPHMGRALMGGGSSIDRNHPSLWISGTATPIYIANASFEYPGRGIVIGEDSNHSRTGSGGVSVLTLENVTANLSDVRGNGPCMDITGQSFWIWLKDWGCGGTDDTNPPTDDRSAAVLIDGRTNAGLGLVFLYHGNTSNGGVKLYAGTNVSQVVVDGLTTEGQKGEPAVWIASTGTSGDNGTTAEVHNVEVADATGSTPALRNDTGTAGSVLGSNLMGNFVNVTGAATVLSQYGPNLQSATLSPLRQGQTGFFNGHVVGAIDNTQRSFSPTAVRFANVATTSALKWTFTGDRNSTFTPGIIAPDGTSGAAEASATGALPESLYLYPPTNRTIFVGDYFVGAAFVRSRTANGYVGGTPIQIVVSGTGVQTSCRGVSNTVAGDGQWDWVYEICKVIAAPRNPYVIELIGLFDSRHTLQAYAPVLNYIRAGTLSENEVYSYAAALMGYANTCSVGSICGLSGQSLSEDTLTANVHVNQGSAHQWSDTVTLSAGTKTIAFQVKYNSRPVCVVSDETVAGGARIGAISESGITIVGGTADLVDYICVGNPN
jgi:hypothetical protein